MTRERGHLLHAGVPPHDNLVQRVTVRTDNFVAVLRPGHVAHLTARVNLVEAHTTERIPKANAAIGRTAPTGQETVLVWRPSNGLDGGRVFGKLVHRIFGVAAINHVQVVVVATRRQKGRFVKGPLETTDFLLVVGQLAGVVLGLSQITQINQAIPTATGQDGTRPGQGPDAGRMARHGTNFLGLHRVPQLDFTQGGADGQVRAALGPGDGTDVITRGFQVDQFGHLGRAGTPQVHTGAQTNGQDVLGRPIDQIEIKVVLQGGCIQDLEGYFGNASFAFGRCRHESLTGRTPNGREGKGMKGGVTGGQIFQDLVTVVLSGTAETQLIRGVAVVLLRRVLDLGNARGHGVLVLAQQFTAQERGEQILLGLGGGGGRGTGRTIPGIVTGGGGRLFGTTRAGPPQVNAGCGGGPAANVAVRDAHVGEKDAFAVGCRCVETNPCRVYGFVFQVHRDDGRRPKKVGVTVNAGRWHEFLVGRGRRRKRRVWCETSGVLGVEQWSTRRGQRHPNLAWGVFVRRGDTRTGRGTVVIVLFFLTSTRTEGRRILRGGCGG